MPASLVPAEALFRSRLVRFAYRARMGCWLTQAQPAQQKQQEQELSRNRRRISSSNCIRNGKRNVRLIISYIPLRVYVCVSYHHPLALQGDGNRSSSVLALTVAIGISSLTSRLRARGLLRRPVQQGQVQCFWVNVSFMLQPMLRFQGRI